MTTIERRLTSVKRGGLRTWLLFLALASLPFLVRLHLDMRQTDQMAVQGLYRVWRWSPAGHRLRAGRTIIFRRVNDRSVAEELFLAQLQREFKIVEYGAHPEIRGYFDEGDEEGEGSLRARIEVREGPHAPVQAWSGEHRRADNGWIVGPWLGAVLFLMGKSPATAALAAAGAILLWDADLSPLDMPARVVDFWGRFALEIRARAVTHDWNSAEVGRVPLVAFLICLVPLVVWAFLLHRRSRHWPASRKILVPLALSLAAEPLMFWAASRFGDWEGGASWWKVYVGGLGYRFFLGALIFGRYFGLPLDAPESEGRVEERPWTAGRALTAIALPFVFLGANGWDWAGSVLMPGLGETLVHLRFFLAGALLGFTLGSRFFGMTLALLAFGVFAQPTMGHWNSSALYGMLMEGLLAGWWLTPFNPASFGLILGGRHVLAVAVLAWVAGVLLSSVGVPLGVCWVALLAGVWVYTQTIQDKRYEDGPPWKRSGEAWS